MQHKLLQQDLIHLKISQRVEQTTIKSCVCSLSGRIQVLPQGMTCIITDISDITVHVLPSFINLYIEFVFLAC